MYAELSSGGHNPEGPKIESEISSREEGGDRDLTSGSAWVRGGWAEGGLRDAGCSFTSQHYPSLVYLPF